MNEDVRRIALLNDDVPQPEQISERFKKKICVSSFPDS